MSKTYKATNEDMTCLNHKFEIGKEYKIDGELVICRNGFHSCKNPLDCLNFYDLCNSRFFETTASGECDKDSNKICSTKITLNAELSMCQYIEKSVDYIIDLCEFTKKEKQQLQTANSGYGVKTANSGYGVKTANSGDGVQTANSGDRVQTANSGYCVQTANSGNRVQTANSGDGGTEIITGNNSVAASIGQNCKIKAVKGTWITLAEYKNGIVCFVKTGQIGYTEQDGTRLKANVFYKLKNRKFVEVN